MAGPMRMVIIVSRVFISHSSQDNVAAVALKQWLGSNGWADEDVFLDLDQIEVGETWKKALAEANARCEAVIFLASATSLVSAECITEVRTAENFGKEIVILLLEDILEGSGKRNLAKFDDRQIGSLAAVPLSHVETITYRGQSHEVHFNGETLDKLKRFLERCGIAPDILRGRRRIARTVSLIPVLPPSLRMTPASTSAATPT